jgi:redox-sensitive bicupin YhaK (pirin superfamily)
MTDAVADVIVPRSNDLGDGFIVRRALPSRRRSVGPFVFFDEMGPTRLPAGGGLDVRPHPHIGLATITYLFEGEILHRDSLGTVQTIRPGEVNWMTAGRGIVHSERTPPALRAAGPRLAGIQLWVALPREHEECEPQFAHVEAAALPQATSDGVTLRLIVGTLNGERSPVQTHSPMFYADAQLAAGARLSLSSEHEERAAYVVSGAATVAGQAYEAGRLLLFQPGVPLLLGSDAGARLMLLGGTSLGERHVWWNLVSSSWERIEQAKADWRAGRFAPVPGESEFIPLPDDPPPAVRYP